MAIVLEANYAKKLGLPNFSSHQYSVTIRTELTDLTQVEEASARLYGLLQDAVDREIQHVGFMPDASTYGMKNGNGHPSNGPASGNGHPSNGNGNGGNARRPAPAADGWACTEGQQKLVLQLVHDHQLDKGEIETMAQQLFGIGVKELNKMQASNLIDELLEKVGEEDQPWPASLAESGRSAVMIALAAPPPPAPVTPAPSEAQTIASLKETVSPSRLTLFLQCRLKFWFRYVARLVKPKSAALHVGSSVHAVLKAWNKARWRQTPLTLKQLHDEFTTAWADEAEGPVPWEAGEEDEEKKTGWRLLETYFRESKIPVEVRPEAVEVPVEAGLHQHGLPTLIGVLDLVQAGTIIDFKTSSTTPNPEKVAHTTEVQTSSYAVLYREATDRRETGIELHHLVKLKNPKLVVTAMPPMSDLQETRLFRLMEVYVAGLERQDFVPSPGMQCASCEFFNECRLWA